VPGPGAARDRRGSYPAAAGYRGQGREDSQVARELRDRLGVGGAAAGGRGARRPSRHAPGATSQYGPPGEYGPEQYGPDGQPAYGPGGQPGQHSTLQRERRSVRAADSWPDELRRRTGRGGGSGGGTGGRGFRHWLRSGSWWRRWTWRKALAVLASGVAFVVLVIVAATLYLYSKTQIPDAALEAALSQSSTVYYGGNGGKVGLFSTGQNRELLTSQQIPADLKNAVIAAEDRHFYSEGGISPTGILRAAYEDATGGTFQGGSTITEQFVKNYYAGIGTGRTAKTKLKEIFVSIKLSHEKSKDWILTNYLNTVYFGDEAYGAGAAAQTYFAEPASKLTVSQAAMLAALVNQPGSFSPDPHSTGYAPLVARWKYVLGNMVRDGVLTDQQMAQQKFPKVVHTQLNNTWSGWRGYVMSVVLSELESRYGFTRDQIYTGGLQIHTTISKPLMQKLYAAVNQNEKLMKQGGEGLPRFAHIGATLEQPGTGAILAMYGGPNYEAKHCDRIHCQYNMALAPQQVGSSFKPYVLATAVQQGMSVQKSVLNGFSPICIPPDSTATYRAMLSTRGTSCDTHIGFWPFNESAENLGPISVPEAVAQSSDPGFEDLIHRVGVQNTIQMAQSLGVSKSDIAALEARFGPHGTNAGSVTAALGSGNLTSVDQANTFADFAADGKYAQPHVISKIVKPGGGLVPIQIAHGQPLNPQQAADVDYALSFTNQDSPLGGGAGTAFGSASWDRPVISKTGTLGVGEISSDAWLVGATPNASLAVGMFTDKKTQSLDGIGGIEGGFGGTWPARIWKSFMASAYESAPVQQFAAPDFAGFQKWVQVAVHHKKVKQPKPGHGPSPFPTPTCQPGNGNGNGNGHGNGGGPCPSPSPGPFPTPTPTPTPTPSPSPGCVPGLPCQSPSPPGTGGGKVTGRAQLTAQRQVATVTVAAVNLPRSRIAMA
jgi:membrane peptidoglycan carboxypeptidase